jgi:hypothetical protein
MDLHKQIIQIRLLKRPRFFRVGILPSRALPDGEEMPRPIGRNVALSIQDLLAINGERERFILTILRVRV